MHKIDSLAIELEKEQDLYEAQRIALEMREELRKWADDEAWCYWEKKMQEKYKSLIK